MSDVTSETEKPQNTQNTRKTQPDDGPPRLTRLAFHNPLSEARAAGIVRRLAGAGPRTVLDLGCGWGELMLRVLTAVPEARGSGSM